MLRKLCAIVVALFISPVLGQSITPQIGGGISKGFDGGISGGGAAAPALWTPSNLGAALVAWWDPSDTAHITFNTGTVASWVDRAGGNALIQATGANQPGWSATALNGAPGLTFNGSQAVRAATTTLPSGTAASTISVSAQLTVNASFQRPFYQGGTVGGQFRVVQANIGNHFVIGVVNSGITFSQDWTGTNRFVVFGVTNGAQTMFVDGTSAGTSADAVATSSTSLAVGGDPSGANNWQGVVQQIVVTNATLSTNQRQCLEGWESWIDGKTGGNLPTANPYSSTGTLHRAPLVTDSCT